MGFLAPTGLASLGFLGLLVFLHLRRRHQREVEVSSLLLCRFSSSHSPAQLGLVAGRPFWSERAAPVTAGRTVFVFDVSASMQAVEGGERRFDQARRKAGEVLTRQGRDVEIMMIAVAARPRVVVAFTRDRSVVARALEALEPGDGPTRLSLGIQLAHSASSGGPLEIDVFTDLPSDAVGFAPSAGERLRYFRFGRSDDNVALAALRVYQNPFQSADEAP